MKTSAKILADSLSNKGHRLVSYEVTFPRCILAEVNTHRQLAKSSASSRAIPILRMLQMVQEHPYIPTRWPVNDKGMSTQEYTVDPGLIQMHRDQWLRARDYAVLVVNQLLIQYVHKQTTNRLLEPFMWHTAVLTGTDWPNFQHLRNHPDAHPDFQDLAVAMQAAFDDSKPAIPVDGEYWHTPYVNNSEVIEWENGPGGWPYACKVSAGRCARVSYLRQGEGNDPDSDVSRTDRMLVDGHLSPLEHCARPMTNEEYAESAVYWYEENGKMTWSRDRLSVGKLIRETHYCGNLDGWVSMRKEIPYEWDILGHRAGGSV